MTQRENSDLLRLIFLELLDDENFTYRVIVMARDFEAHEFLKSRHYKYDRDSQSWLPWSKGFQVEYAEEEFDSFRDRVCEFLSAGYLLYSFSALDLCQWLRTLHLREVAFAIRSRSSLWQEKLLKCSKDFEVSRLRHDGRYYLGKIFAWQNQTQMREDRNFTEEKKGDQPTLFELDEGVIH